MSEPKKLYEVGQTIHHGEKSLEVTAVREVTTHVPQIGDEPAHDKHEYFEYTLRDHVELDAEREAAEAARTGHEEAPVEA
jgi:hypothetical protein